MSTLVKTMKTTAWKGKRFLSLPNDVREQITNFFLKLGSFDRWQIERNRRGPRGFIHQFIPELSKIDILACVREVDADVKLSSKYCFIKLFEHSESFKQYIYTYVPKDIIMGKVNGYFNSSSLTTEEEELYFPKKEREARFACGWLGVNNRRVLEIVHEICFVVFTARRTKRSGN